MPQTRRGYLARMAVTVVVLAPSPLLTVTIEDRAGEPDIHVHAGGQGVWQARMLGSLGVRVVLCAGLGGEAGDVLEHLLPSEGLTLKGDPDRRPQRRLRARPAGRRPHRDRRGAGWSAGPARARRALRAGADRGPRTRVRAAVRPARRPHRAGRPLPQAHHGPGGQRVQGRGRPGRRAPGRRPGRSSRRWSRSATRSCSATVAPTATTRRADDGHAQVAQGRRRHHRGVPGRRARARAGRRRRAGRPYRSWNPPSPRARATR